MLRAREPDRAPSRPEVLDLFLVVGVLVDALVVSRLELLVGSLAEALEAPAEVPDYLEFPPASRELASLVVERHHLRLLAEDLANLVCHRFPEL